MSTVRGRLSRPPGPALGGVLRAVLGLAVVVVAFAVILPRFASYADVWPHLRALRPAVLAWLIPVAAINLVAPSLSQVAALPGLRLGQAVAADWSTSAITNVVPGGSAISIGVIYTLYRRWGLSASSIARAIVVTGVWDLLVKLSWPLPAVAWLATERPVDTTLLQAAVIGGVLFVGAALVFASLLVSPAVGRMLGALIDRAPFTGEGWGERLNDQRRDTLELLAERGPWLTLTTIAGHANLLLLLVLCLRAVGLESSALSTAAIAAAFTFGRLVTAVPLTPGGLGVMEVGLVGALMAFAPAAAGETEAAVVAGVLLFRFFSYAVPIPLGAVTLATITARSGRFLGGDDSPVVP